MSRSEEFDAGRASLDDIAFKFAPAESEDELHRLDAYQIRPGRIDSIMGGILWHPKTGRVDNIFVFPEHRRKGVATRLWNHAQTLPGIVPPKHSTDRTPMGDAWAKSTGEEPPPPITPYIA